MPHSHNPLSSRLSADKRALSIALVVVMLSSVLQFSAGIVAHSSVLRVEALHSLLDGLTVIISLISVFVASKSPNHRFTYGYGRAEILSALVSVGALALLCVKLFVEAIERLKDVLSDTKSRIHVEGRVVMIAESVALSCNIFIALVLSRGAGPSLNLKALRAHVIADSVENMVVLFAGFLMWLNPRLSIIDPVLTIVIVVVIVVLNWGIASESINALMQAAPESISPLIAGVNKVVGVETVGDVHVWTLTSGSVMGSVEVEVEGHGGWDELERVDNDVRVVLERNGVDKATVQIRRRRLNGHAESGGNKSHSTHDHSTCTGHTHGDHDHGSHVHHHVSNYHAHTHGHNVRGAHAHNHDHHTHGHAHGHGDDHSHSDNHDHTTHGHGHAHNHDGSHVPHHVHSEHERASDDSTVGETIDGHEMPGYQQPDSLLRDKTLVDTV